MKRKWLFLLIAAFAASCLAACGGAPAPTNTTAPAATAPPAGQIVTATRPSATTVRSSESSIATATRLPAGPTNTPALPTATTRPAATPTEDTLSLTSRDEGLDKLASYRMHWQAQWTTTESGKTEKGSWDWVEEYTADPKALHWTWAFSDTTGTETTAMESWQIGDTMYIVTTDADGESSCVSVSSSDPSSQMNKGLFSAATLGAVKNAKYVGTETVNGVRAKHYTYSEQSLSLRNVGKAAGEVWVAADGGYVVKETMQWEGSAGMFGGSDAGKGQGAWTWNLTDANKPITITAPDNCGGGTATLPVMADAKDKSSFGDMLTYTTPSKVSAVVDFYKKEMKAAGWTPGDESTPMEGMGTLEFTKEGAKATVTIISGDKGTTVMINLEEE